MGGNQYTAQPLEKEPTWPALPGPYLVLLETSGPLEKRLLNGWIARHKPDAPVGDVQIAYLPQTRRRRRRRKLDPRIEAFLQAGANPLLIPLRVSWLPEERKGRRSVGWHDLLTLGDPRDPDPLRQFAIYRFHPSRCRIVAGEPERAETVRAAWNDPDGRGRAGALVTGPSR